MVCWSMTHIQMCGYFIHCYVAICLHDGFNCCNVLWCHYLVCQTRSRRVCYRTNAVHELPSPLVHLLQWQTYITVTELSFMDEFQWVSPLHYLKKRMTEHWSSLVHVASGAAIFTLLTAPSCCIPAPYCHLSATLQTISITVVNLQDNRAVFRIFIALFKFFIWLSLVRQK